MGRQSTIEFDAAGIPVSKWCTGCESRLPIAEFPARAGGEGYRSCCAPCTKMRRTQYRAAEKTRITEMRDEIAYFPSTDRIYDWDAILQRDGWGNHDYF